MISHCFFIAGMCPVLCSGHGDYEDGQCRCFPGWKGLECQLRHDQCEVADCSGHGQCVNGKCVCARGYTGNACQQSKYNNHVACSSNSSLYLPLFPITHTERKYDGPTSSDRPIVKLFIKTILYELFRKDLVIILDTITYIFFRIRPVFLSLFFPNLLLFF